MVSIPHKLCDAQHDVCLYVDIMYVKSMPFLTTISKNIKYHTTMRVADCTPRTIASLVESVLELYQWASFQVTEVCADHEFKPVLQILQANGWSFTTNLANAQEHVPEAEHNNCILKEHIHATYHGILYKMLPQTIICYMVMETTAKLNYFPAISIIAPYFLLQRSLIDMIALAIAFYECSCMFALSPKVQHRIVGNIPARNTWDVLYMFHLVITKVLDYYIQRNATFYIMALLQKPQLKVDRISRGKKGQFQQPYVLASSTHKSSQSLLTFRYLQGTMKEKTSNITHLGENVKKSRRFQ